MSNEERFEFVDPVLLRLEERATQLRLSREGLAQRLGVSRSTVAGWFLTLEALRHTGNDLPKSGREFRFTKQKPDVQKKIQLFIGGDVALESLIEESTGTVGGSGADAVTNSMLSDLTLGVDGAVTAETRHRGVEAIETVKEVVATAVVVVPFGRDYATPYQYQIVVFIEPATDRQDEHRKRRIRDAVDAALRDSGMTCYWELGRKVSTVTITSNNVAMQELGTLSLAVLKGKRDPRKALLVRPTGRTLSPSALRVAAFVGPAYSGPSEIAGLCAIALGAGHIPAEEWIREVKAKLVARRSIPLTTPTTRYSMESAEPDAGFMLHKVIYQLERGYTPGAWCISMEASTPAGYGPLTDALTYLNGPLIVVRYGELWRRMAAWRLAAKDMTDKSKEPFEVSEISETDPDRARLIQARFMEHLEYAEIRYKEIDKQQENLDAIVKKRQELDIPLPTLTWALDDFSDEIDCVRLHDGAFLAVSGPERLIGQVAFASASDELLTGAWTKAAVEVLDGLARLAGYTEEMSDLFTQQLEDGLLRDARTSRGGESSEALPR